MNLRDFKGTVGIGDVDWDHFTSLEWAIMGDRLLVRLRDLVGLHKEELKDEIQEIRKLLVVLGISVDEISEDWFVATVRELQAAGEVPRRFEKFTKKIYNFKRWEEILDIVKNPKFVRAGLNLKSFQYDYVSPDCEIAEIKTSEEDQEVLAAVLAGMPD